MPSSAQEVTTTSSAPVRSYSEAIARRSSGLPGDSVYPHQHSSSRSWASRLELEQLRYRPRLTVAAREHEPGAVFVLSVEALNPERAQFHDN